MTEMMRIGELAERAGVTPRTIRYYEALGLLGPCRRAGTGFRYYSEVELARLRKIDALKELGLSLEEIKSVIDLYCDGRPDGAIQGKQRLLDILRAHLRETDEKLEALARFRAELTANIARIEAALEEVRAR